MNVVFWDSSGIAKRFIPEVGSAIVDEIFDVSRSLSLPMVALSVVYAETFSLNVRKRNRGDIDAATFAFAASTLRREMAQDPAFTLLEVDNSAVFALLPFIDRHSINASDALILVQYLRYVAAQPGIKGILVASDARPMRTAAQEEFAVLDPEKATAGEVSASLSSP